MQGFVIALSNAWGLFNIIIFLGYGLVTVPKECLRMASLTKNYENAMFKVVKGEESMQHAKLMIEDVTQNIMTIKHLKEEKGE